MKQGTSGSCRGYDCNSQGHRWIIHVTFDVIQQRIPIRCGRSLCNGSTLRLAHHGHNGPRLAQIPNKSQQNPLIRKTIITSSLATTIHCLSRNMLGSPDSGNQFLLLRNPPLQQCRHVAKHGNFQMDRHPPLSQLIMATSKRADEQYDRTSMVLVAKMVHPTHDSCSTKPRHT
jgi:hypothetical protein